MEAAPLLKLLSDGTGWGVAAVFLALFLGALKYIVAQHKQHVDLLRENIAALNAMSTMNGKMLKVLGVDDDG